MKHEQKMDCGGGYIKVFPSDLDQKKMNGKSQYYIMFGKFRKGSHVFPALHRGSAERTNITALNLRFIALFCFWFGLVCFGFSRQGFSV